MIESWKSKNMFMIYGPVRVPLNPAWSAYFFIRNSVFLSQIHPAFLQTIEIPLEFRQANKPILFGTGFPGFAFSSAGVAIITSSSLSSQDTQAK